MLREPKKPAGSLTGERPGAGPKSGRFQLVKLEPRIAPTITYPTYNFSYYRLVPYGTARKGG